MGNVLKVDCSTGSGNLVKNWGTNEAEVWVSVDVALDATALADLLTGAGFGLPTQFDLIELSSHTSEDSGAELYADTGPVAKWAAYNTSGDPASTPFTPSPPVTSMQFYRVKIHIVAGTPATQEVWVGGATIGSITAGNMADSRLITLFQPGLLDAGFVYYGNVKVGTTDGGTDIFSDDFESGSLAGWTSADAVFSIVTDPGIAAAGSAPLPAGRVWIAFDDDPLEPNPTWTLVDDPTGVTFPKGFVAGYDVDEGKQTLLDQTDTGTATVYVNDHELGLFDDRNVSSPYQGKLSGKQIRLQLYDPFRAVWERQFQGLIDSYTYDMDGSAKDANGDPINASIQIDCVNVFDYLAGYGLTPGLDGITPPAGGEDGVWYAETIGTVDDRIIEILTDVGIDSTRYVVFSGNVSAQAVKYDPDESALVALRDAADAELPFIANIYCDRFGRFCFHGRYARFDPDGVSSDAGTDRWDFHRWKVGDGKAIQADATRAQLRTLSYIRDRGDLINVATAYPANMPAPQMPSQVYANTSSITSYGRHSAPPMSYLLTAEPIFDAAHGGPADRYEETAAFAQLLVLNKKDPIVAISSLTLKTVSPTDPRASVTWEMLTQADISDIVNIKVGYPGGTGFTGASPEDDYFVEGRKLKVRPATSTYDSVELELDLSPARWSMDINGVFPLRS